MVTVNPYRNDLDMAQRDLDPIGLAIGAAIDCVSRLTVLASQVEEPQHRGLLIHLAGALSDLTDDFRDDAIHQPMSAIADADEYWLGRLDYDYEIADEVRKGK